MIIAAWGLVAIGGALSLGTLLANYRRNRAEDPYTRMGNFGPELQVVFALFTGAGAWIGWGWIAGAAAFLGHAGVAFTLGLRMFR